MLELVHIQKKYNYQNVLKDISMKLPDTGLIGIVGPSGCGKSTLLNIMGGIDKDFSGDLLFEGQSVKRKLTRYCKKHVSFIFQQLHLIMWLSIMENIRLPQYFHKEKFQSKNSNILDFKKLKISYLSLGQRQRVAFLRTCYHKRILLCDEPTSSLDLQNTRKIMQLLKEQSKQRLVVIVSHELTLIEEYCDQIYEMKDGKIINHIQLNDSLPIIFPPNKKKRKAFPYLCLSLHSLFSYKRRTFQMIIGFALALICVLITLTMSQNFERQIHQYIYSLVPPCSISVQSVHQSLNDSFIEMLKGHHEIERIQLFLDDYEQLGISFKGGRYQESQTLFIGDDTAPYQNLLLMCGRMPLQNNEILVSKSTAKHLCIEDIKELLGMKVFVWYKYQTKVIPIVCHVVGITQNTTTVDTFYQRENAYIELLKEDNVLKTIKSHMGIIFINSKQDRTKFLNELRYKYPQYKFIETGASTQKHISSTMQQIKIVLYVFSSLAILSSLFLIGEVMFLNVVQKKKDYAIMKCLGAGFLDFLRLILCETIEIVSIVLLIVFIIYFQMIYLFNQFFKQIIINGVMTLSIDFSLVIKIILLSFIMVLLCQMIPLVYMMRLNTANTLKG